MKKQILFFLCATTLIISAATEPYRALTIVPVANLSFQPLAPLFPHKNVLRLYQEMTLEGTKGSVRSCPRAHQLIFNEIIEIADHVGDEVLVRIPQCYFTTNTPPFTKNHEYWSHKSFFIPLKKLKHHALDLSQVPSPIDFESGSIANANAGVATLLFPYKNPATDTVFSAGTRFVTAQPTQKEDEHVIVWVFDHESWTTQKLSIPKHLCIIHYPQDKELLRTAFVQLLRLWAESSTNSVIPYVWGGCSFTTFYPTDMITGPENPTPKATSPFFINNKKIMGTGFDCSGVILRAAQILNIPYFFKNSFTALNTLTHIMDYKDLKIGDLLYIAGHVMIVADLKKNTLIEARSHYHGFGKLQEIKLSDEFKGITTYQQLISAYTQKKPLERLDARRNIIAIITDAQLLKLPV